MIEPLIEEEDEQLETELEESEGKESIQSILKKAGKSASKKDKKQKFGLIEKHLSSGKT